MKRTFNIFKSHKKNFNENNTIDIDINKQVKNVNKVTNTPFTLLRKSKKTVNDNLMLSFLTAIDNKNKNKIEKLYKINNKNNNIENNMIYEIYNENKLNSERLQFVVENCTSYLNITSSFIKELMKSNNKELLEILFKKHFKFFDNELILYLLKNYERRTPVSDSELYPIVNDIKYKISTELDKYFNRYDSSYYLFNACKSGNEAAVKFLLEHGADLNIKDKDNRDRKSVV